MKKVVKTLKMEMIVNMASNRFVSRLCLLRFKTMGNLDSGMDCPCPFGIKISLIKLTHI